MKIKRTRFIALAILLTLAFAIQATAQDWIRTGTGLGVEKVRLAAADFRATSPDPQTSPLSLAFNQTLWSDLDSAGIFDMVSKSFYPLVTPSTPQDLKADAWGNPPPNASMVAFGNLGISSENLLVQGWLFDVKNPGAPMVLGKQYREAATVDNARLIAHRFADEIIYRLGGGVPGVSESRMVFVSDRTGHKEIWEMDYDGAGQNQLTHLGSISLSPRISPDGSRVAFASFARGGLDILMYSLDLNKVVTFPRLPGMNMSPAWSPDGAKLAFASSMHDGDTEIYVADAATAHDLKRLTAAKGPDVSPVWNPKTGAQIAFVSGRSGLPQIYEMESDGTNLQKLTEGGYAVSPSWSPNGQFLVFSWMRNYGPGIPGAQDIYIMDIASRQWVQLTHDAGRNDFPSWSPDGRHIVFQSDRGGSDQIWSMLADGTHQQQLTRSGRNTQPNWSFK